MKRKNKNKFKNPHYSSRKRLPDRRSPRSFFAKFYSSKNGGVAFRVLNADLLPSSEEVPLPNEAGQSYGVRDGFRIAREDFVPVLDEKVKYYIDHRHTASAVNGDIVRLNLLHHHDAEVTDVVCRGNSSVLGILYQAEDQFGEELWVLEPDDKKLDFNVIITSSQGFELKDGYRALVRITEYPEDGYDDALGCLLRVYGDAESRNACYQAILDANSVITEFSSEAISEAERLAELPLTVDNRVDMRDRLIFTLDGAGAKDLDDAISVEKQGDRFVLGVHIADVSHYVAHRSRLDKEAMARGTSIYFADRVVPMLPTALSNGICSLNADVDRYALSATMVVDKSGEIISTSLCKSIIRSKLRGVYSEFNTVMSGDASSELEEKYAVIPAETRETLSELYRILKSKSDRRGALELESSEAAVVLDENGDPVSIVRRESGLGEAMIEQFMLCANEGVADWLTERGLPCVYRIHEQPSEEKLSAFLNLASDLGLRPEYIKRGSAITAKYFSGILDRARERELATPISYMLLRTMMKARYSEVRSGHFGLGASTYCHFTSPIRRYPDLSVHRIISFALTGVDPRAVSDKFAGFAALSAKNSSECELRALTVEREMDQLFKAIYLSKRIGQIYPAVISSVTPFGFFCRTPETCEGLVPISSLDGFFQFNENTLSLVGDGAIYRIGDTVAIRVENVEIATCKVDFSLVADVDADDASDC